MSLDNFKIGVGTHLGQASNTVYQNWTNVKNALDDLGITRIRDDIYWSYVETTPGTIDTSQATAAIQAMVADPGDYTGVLIASYGNSFYGDDQPDDPAARTAFAAYWNQLVTDFGSDFESFEVWNEWNLGAGNPGNVADADSSGASYALLVDALTIPEPTPEVITGATGDDLSDWQFTKDFFASGSFAAGDAYSVHLYNYNNGSGAVPEEMIARLERLQEILRTYNSGQDYPVYVTEFGWPTHNASGGVTELLSGSYLARFLLEASGYSWIEGAWIYDLFNDGVDPANREHNFGLYENDGTTEKAGTKYVKAAIALMKDYTFVSKGYVSSTVRYLEFAHDTNSNYAYVIFDSEKDGSKAISIDYTPVEFASGAINTLSTIATADYTITEEPQIVVTLGAVELSPGSDQTGAVSAGGTAATATITHGLTFEAGDVIFAFIHSNYGVTPGFTDANGVTPFTSEMQWNDGGVSGQQIAIFTRVATGAEPAAFNFDIDEGAQRYSIHVRSYRNLNPNDLWDVPPLAENVVTAGSQGIDIPGISTRSMYAEAIAFVGTDTGAATIYSGVTNSFYDELEQQLDQPSATYRKAITDIGPVGDSSVTASVGGQTFALMMAIKNGRYATPTVGSNIAINLDQWNEGENGHIRGFDKVGAGGTPPVTPPVSTLINETFAASPLTGDWYDSASNTGFTVGTNPTDSTPCYTYTWLAGQTQNPVDASARHLFTPSDVIDVEFDMCMSPTPDLTVNTHCIYIRLNTSGIYDPPGAGNGDPNGFTLYLESAANGQVHIDSRLSNDVTWRTSETVGAPSLHAGIMRTIRVVAIMNDVGQANGQLIVFVNGVEYINETNWTFRLAANEQFGQLILGPHIDAADPQAFDLTMYVDNLTLKNGYSPAADNPNYPFEPNRPIAASPRYVDPVNGSNSNDGLTEGTAWETLQHAINNAVAGNHVYLMNGTHRAANGGTGEGGEGVGVQYVNSGTAQNKITVTSLPGHTPLIDCEGQRGFSIYGVDHWHFEYLDVLNFNSAFRIGYNDNARNITFHSVDGRTNTGVDNGGLIDFSANEFAEVSGRATRCRTRLTVSPDSVSVNTGGFHVLEQTHAMDISFDRCEAYNYNKPMFFKTGSNPGSHTAAHRVTNCFFPLPAGSTFFAMGRNQSGALFQNTIFGGPVAYAESNGSQGGDYNWHDHCTFGGIIQLRDQDDGSNIGAIQNRFTNSILDSLRISPASSVDSASDYNLYATADVETNSRFEGDGSAVNVPFATWASGNGSDANSIVGAPVFVGGDPETIAYWALQEGSPGKNAASDGTDMGADISKVGIFGAD